MTQASIANSATPAIPASAWRLIVLEFWERFSYYGILAILVLFLAGPTAGGGFGWSRSQALDLLSIFASVAFALPMIGGFIADRWLGAKRAVLIGSGLLVLGNIAIAAAALLHGAPVAQQLLYVGLTGVALGNGFFKSSLVTLLGSLIEGDDAARDRAFRYYYQAIMLGALAASLLVGALAQNIGWWSGFALAAFGMAISFTIFVTKPPADPQVKAAAVSTQSTDKTLAGAAVDVGILCVFLTVITVGWVQFQGVWLLEMDRTVDRTIGSFTVPSSWLLAVNAVIVVLFTPASGRIWRKIVGAGDAAPSFPGQFAAAFALMGVAHLLMSFGFRGSDAGQVALAWPVACVLLITLGELIFWPSSYNAIHRLAPPSAKSLFMGMWLATLGLGQYVCHQVGRTAETIGFASLSGYIGAGMIVACLAVLAISRLRPSLRML